MFPIKSPTCMRQVPPSLEFFCNWTSFFWTAWTWYQFILVFEDYGPADFWNSDANRVSATLKSYYRVGYLSPEARSLIVMASFKPGSRHFLRLVSFLWILGPTLFNISSNMAPKMRWCPPYSALSLICDSGQCQFKSSSGRQPWPHPTSLGPPVPPLVLKFHFHLSCCSMANCSMSIAFWTSILTLCQLKNTSDRHNLYKIAVNRVRHAAYRHMNGA